MIFTVAPITGIGFFKRGVRGFISRAISNAVIGEKTTNLPSLVSARIACRSKWLKPAEISSSFPMLGLCPMFSRLFLDTAMEICIEAMY